MSTKPFSNLVRVPAREAKTCTTVRDRLNEKHALRAQQKAGPRLPGDVASAIVKQERAVAEEFSRLRDKENPKIKGRRGRRPFSRGSKAPVRRINVRRKP